MCPFCSSGAGLNGTSAMSINGKTFNCVACSKSGDIFTLSAKVYELDIKIDFPEILQRTCNELGINNSNGTSTETYQISIPTTPKLIAVKHDYSDYLFKSKKALSENNKAKEYLYNRGLTDATIDRFRLGYNTSRFFQALNSSLPSIVIPYNAENTYLAEKSIENKGHYKPNSTEAGLEPVFNADSLTSSNSVFVTEGIFDALSIEQLGFRAVSIGGTGIDGLCKALSNIKSKPKLIITLDNDEAGDRSAQRISKKLQEEGILHTIENLTKEIGCKDANEALIANSEKLKERLETVKKLYSLKINMPNNDAIYIENGFFRDMKNLNKSKPAKTGLVELDKQLEGGLYSGLYVLGAATSVGKTALCHQIACSIANSGRDVLFFSMEMSKLEMVSRGIARILKKEKSSSDVSSLDIRRETDENKLKEYTQKFIDYVGTNINDIECPFDYTVNDITSQVEAFISKNPKRESPVVFIDYLQLLSLCESNKNARREEIDQIVKFLKKFSTEYKLPVLVVSAINRGNYVLPVSNESFKESGGIEYTADVVIGLQMACLSEGGIFDKDTGAGEKRKKIQEALIATPRKVQLLILKNRGGQSGGRINLDYHSKCEFFSETSERHNNKKFV